MTHHTEEHGDEGGGPEMEKWILRLLLLAATALSVTVVVASLDDIKRYLRMRQM